MNEMGKPASTVAEPLSFRSTWPIASLIAGAFFMEMLDGTVIGTALPAMARSFGVSPVDLNLGMTAYMLALAIFIPLSGWISERQGARATFATAITVFTLASMLCGASTGLWSFIAARILQGLGGALMVPVGRLVVLRNTPKADLVRAIAILTWPALTAPVLGPPIGGFITEHASWRWIFYLNLPLGVIGLVLTFFLVPNLKGTARRPLDWRGFLLIAVASTLLVYGLGLVGSATQDILVPAGLVGAAVLLGAIAGWHSARHPTPLLEFSALRIPTYFVANATGSLQRAAMSSAPFLLPLMFQIGFGLDPFASGLLLLALFAGNISMKPMTTAVLRRFGFKRVLIGNGLILAAALAACGLLWPSTPTAIVCVVLFIGGMSRSMQFTALNTVGFADVPQARMAMANTVATLLEQLSMGTGVALGAVVLRASAWLHGTPPKSFTTADFHGAFALIGILTLLALPGALRLEPAAGAHVSGHRQD